VRSDRRTDRHDVDDRLKRMKVTRREESLFPPVVAEQLMRRKDNHIFCEIVEFLFRIRNY